MAISFYQEPDSPTPAYNDMHFLIDSTNKAQANFKYIFDVWYDGIFQHRFKIPPRPDGYGVLNVARVIESLVTYDIEGDTDFGILENSNSYKNIVLKFGEEYGSTLVEYPNLSASDVITAFNAALEFLEYPDYSPATYSLSGGTKKFQTNSPASVDIHTGENAWLHFHSTSGANVNRAIIKTYDTSGSLLNTFKVANNFSSASGFFRIGTGPIQLNQIPAPDLISGSQPIIDGTVKSYTINIAKSDDTPTSETKTYSIVDANCKYDNYRLHWLNKIGGFDSFNFDLVSRKRTSIQRKSYKKVPGSVRMVLGSPEYFYTKDERGDIVYDLTYKRSVSITSNWVTDEVAAWLEELFTSPNVYYENSDNELIPIVINNADYEEKKKDNIKLLNYEIDFSFAHSNERQRG